MVPLSNTIDQRLILFPSMDTGWLGGVNYIKNLQTALNEHSHIDIEICKICKPVISKKLSARIMRKLRGDSNPANFPLTNQFELFANGKPYGIYTNNANFLKVPANIPTFYWIPDLQHVYFPQFFTKKDLDRRNRKFKDGITQAKIVILSSESAKNDLIKFYPGIDNKLRVMHFVASVQDRIFIQDPQSIASIYHLPEKFFYIPNQFWQHKNHEILLRALHFLKRQDCDPFLVFSGNTIDYRNQEYFSSLLQLISTLDLRSQVAVLGIIPFEHVQQLIRQSIAVVNPSLFEGWSTTVEEVKSIGKKILLSDIEVHREQSPPESTFFNPQDVDQLSKSLKDVWENTPPGPDFELENKCRHEIADRLKEFAFKFTEIIEEGFSLIN